MLLIMLVFASLAAGAFLLGKQDGLADVQTSHTASVVAPVPRNQQAVPEDSPASDQPPLAPNWAFRTAVDPLTDLSTTGAFSRFSAGPFEIRVMIGCKGNKALGYQLTAFDQDGHAAPLQLTMTGGAQMKESARYSLRLDQDEARSLVDADLRFNNAISFRSNQDSNPMESMAAQAARARRVVAQLHLENGDATIVIDQGHAALRTFLDHCLSGLASETEAQERNAVAQCESRNASIRERALAARAAYTARGEPIPAYLGEEGTPIQMDQHGNGLQQCSAGR